MPPGLTQNAPTLAYVFIRLVCSRSTLRLPYSGQALSGRPPKSIHPASPYRHHSNGGSLGWEGAKLLTLRQRFVLLRCGDILAKFTKGVNAFSVLLWKNTNPRPLCRDLAASLSKTAAAPGDLPAPRRTSARLRSLRRERGALQQLCQIQYEPLRLFPAQARIRDGLAIGALSRALLSVLQI